MAPTFSDPFGRNEINMTPLLLSFARSFYTQLSKRNKTQNSFLQLWPARRLRVRRRRLPNLLMLTFAFHVFVSMCSVCLPALNDPAQRKIRFRVRVYDDENDDGGGLWCVWLPKNKFLIYECLSYTLSICVPHFYTFN